MAILFAGDYCVLFSWPARFAMPVAALVMNGVTWGAQITGLLRVVKKRQ